jgi:pyruvate-formate lyase-activating enzyme
MAHRSDPPSNDLLGALAATASGDIVELDGFAAVGMSATRLAPLRVSETVSLPYGSERMYLPGRIPIYLNLQTGRIEAVPFLPDDPSTRIFPVSVFNSPGYVLRHACAHRIDADAPALPLFSYGAVGWYKGKFRSAAICVDTEPRQDLRLMKIADIRKGIRLLRKRLPGNRLREHLEHCALVYGCPAGKNFFLGRYEAPLPTSPVCNARCLGCLSLQRNSPISSSQNRISFKPSPAEIADVACFHIERVEKAIVSFGQGCEGEPLLAADVIEPAIRRIRSRTKAGTINLNTNASRPDILEKLIDAGLDSMRVSMNSVRSGCYEAYFRPNGFGFSDVCGSIDLALKRGLHVAINYLNLPGFTDSPQEMDALMAFLDRHPVQMIQWRNLNYDPLGYLDAMNAVEPLGEPVGMEELLEAVKRGFPGLRYGYFNPPKESWQT